MTENIPDASASTIVTAPPARVWQALIDPAEIKQYFLGTEVVTDWKVGSRIVFRGELRGKHYEDHGEVLAFEPERRWQITHFSPLSGLPDEPENYHTVEYAIEPTDGGTNVTITQGKNRNAGEVAESEKTWAMVLSNLAEFLEKD